MSVSRQLKALLQKDIVIRKFKRHYFWAVLEFVFPLLIWSEYSWVVRGCRRAKAFLRTLAAVDAFHDQGMSLVSQD